MRSVRFELTRDFSRQNLILVRLPFRHDRVNSLVYLSKSVAKHGVPSPTQDPITLKSKYS